MKVYKFGGASISSLERIKTTAEIIRSHSNEKILIVISALGKTTNALEKVTEAFFEGRKDEALQLFEQVKETHLSLSKYLVTVNWQQSEAQLKDFFTEVEWMLHDKPVRDFDYYYDQVVCSGELMSSSLVSNYLKEEKIANEWIDVRDIIRTNDNFRNAAIDWSFTAKKIEEEILPFFKNTNIIITQGFIGATDENESTTLGREGSDYTAAVFANIMDAENVTIWKDVEAVMNADPRQFPEAVKIPQLSYTEVIEMAYYGAQVIHPKTIKPLQNKRIPLFVKSFIDPSLPGTVINEQNTKGLPQVIIIKEKQVLVQFNSKDFSFVSGEPAEQLHDMINDLHLESNLSQNTAISLFCCFDNSEKISRLATNASELFDVELEKDLTLVTIRHYDDKNIKRFTENKIIVLEQRTLATVQFLIRAVN
ncbi:MAG: aspartate kinase [Ferruginibacter sp.]